MEIFKEYGVLISILSLLFIIAIIKIRYPFWNIQPVYHTYDFWRWLYWTPFVFYRHGPVKTKFYDPIQVKTKEYIEVEPETFNQCIHLIQGHYLETDRILSVISKKYMDAHLTGFNEPAFLSIYRPFSPLENRKDMDIPYEDIEGLIVSRPSKIYLKTEDKSIEESVYFWDFLCAKGKDAKNVRRKLLQTNEFHQYRKNPSIRISIWKEEVTLSKGVVPFVQFKTYTYYLQMRKPPKLPAGYDCVRVYKEHTQLLFDSLYKGGFDFSLIPDFGHILALIQSKVWMVYLLRKKETVCGIYFFKDLHLHYEDLDDETTASTRSVDDLGNSIHLIASIQNVDSPLFYLGYLYSLSLILRWNPKYRILLVEDCADNGEILRRWARQPIFVTDTAYFFFNYFYPRTFSASKSLILI